MAKAPFTRDIAAPTPNVVLGASDTTTIGKAPFAGAVTAVTFTADATLTGAATNTRKQSLVNKGQDGSGTTVIATLQFNSGVNATAFDDKDITLHATATNRNVAAGDVLAWVSEFVGTGIADPGGLVTISIGRS